MLIRLHKQAATTPKIAASTNCRHPVSELSGHGLVELFNGRIEEVIQSRHIRSGEELGPSIRRDVGLYNGSLQQTAIRSCT